MSFPNIYKCLISYKDMKRGKQKKRENLKKGNNILLFFSVVAAVILLAVILTISFPNQLRDFFTVGEEKYIPGETGELYALSSDDNLVAYYKLDGNANDEKGNNGVVRGATLTSGKIGQAYNFDGVDDYINISGVSWSQVLSPESSFTITAWINPGSPLKELPIVAQRHSTSWFFGHKASHLTLKMDDSYLDGTTTLSPNTWYHVAVTYNGATNLSILYLNGVSDKSSTLYDSFSAENRLYIGYESRFNLNFSGIIDEVRIYNTALTAIQVTEVYNYDPTTTTCTDSDNGKNYNVRGTAAGLNSSSQQVSITDSCSGSVLTESFCRADNRVALETYTCANGCSDGACSGAPVTPTEKNPVSYYKFENNANDEYGRNNAVANGSGFVAGKNGQGASFDGNDYIEVPDSASLDINKQVTLAAWINPSNTSSWRRIVAKSHTSNSIPYTMYGLMFDDKNHLRMEIAKGNVQNVVNGNLVIPVNLWTHVAGVYDGSAMKIYVNGVLDNSSSLTGDIDTNNMPLSIGRSGYNRNYFAGIIDEVRVYNISLNDSEIQALYVPTPPVGTCTDSDGGKNYSMKGTTSLGSVNYSDSCTGGDLSVLEYFCESNQIKSESYTCSDVCSHGVCLNIKFNETLIERDIGEIKFIGHDYEDEGCPGLNGTECNSNFVAVYNHSGANITTVGVGIYSPGAFDNSKFKNDIKALNFTNKTILEKTRNGNNYYYISGFGPVYSVDSFWWYNGNKVIGIVIGNLNKTIMNETIVNALLDAYLAKYPSELSFVDVSLEFLSSYWRFEEGGTSSNIEDYFDNNDGNAYGVNRTSAGKAGRALRFDGNNDYVRVGTLKGFGSKLNEFSLAFWVKSDENESSSIMGTVNNGENTMLVVKANSKTENITDNYNNYINYSKGSTTFIIRAENNKDLAGYINKNIYDNNWHLIQWIVANASLNNFDVYVDGTRENLIFGQKELDGSFSNFENAFIIGAENNKGSLGSYFKGVIDEVLILNYSLSLSEVTSHYSNSNSGRSYFEIGTTCLKKTCSGSYSGKCGANLSDGCGGNLNCNNNCASGQVCESGNCVAVKPECSSNSDCDEGFECKDNKCVEIEKPEETGSFWIVFVIIVSVLILGAIVFFIVYYVKMKNAHGKKMGSVGFSVKQSGNANAGNQSLIRGV